MEAMNANESHMGAPADNSSTSSNASPSAKASLPAVTTSTGQKDAPESYTTSPTTKQTPVSQPESEEPLATSSTTDQPLADHSDIPNYLPKHPLPTANVQASSSSKSEAESRILTSKKTKTPGPNLESPPPLTRKSRSGFTVEQRTYLAWIGRRAWNLERKFQGFRAEFGDLFDDEKLRREIRRLQYHPDQVDALLSGVESYPWHKPDLQPGEHGYEGQSRLRSQVEARRRRARGINLFAPTADPPSSATPPQAPAAPPGRLSSVDQPIKTEDSDSDDSPEFLHAQPAPPKVTPPQAPAATPSSPSSADPPIKTEDSDSNDSPEFLYARPALLDFRSSVAARLNIHTRGRQLTRPLQTSAANDGLSQAANAPKMGSQTSTHAADVLSNDQSAFAPVSESTGHRGTGFQYSAPNPYMRSRGSVSSTNRWTGTYDYTTTTSPYSSSYGLPTISPYENAAYVGHHGLPNPSPYENAYGPQINFQPPSPRYGHAQGYGNEATQPCANMQQRYRPTQYQQGRQRQYNSPRRHHQHHMQQQRPPTREEYYEMMSRRGLNRDINDPGSVSQSSWRSVSPDKAENRGGTFWPRP